MIESELDPTECMQEYPSINGVDPTILIKVSSQKAPDDWPETWTCDASYEFETITMGINIQTEQEVRGIVGWKVWASGTSGPSKVDLDVVDSVEEAVTIIENEAF